MENKDELQTDTDKWLPHTLQNAHCCLERFFFAANFRALATHFMHIPGHCLPGIPVFNRVVECLANKFPSRWNWLRCLFKKLDKLLPIFQMLDG
jgi:hypothetical protein